MQTVLEVKQVTKQYGQQYALDHVSLSIQKGDIYGLIGKNGAGKTTLLKTISRLIHANSGTAILPTPPASSTASAFGPTAKPSNLKSMCAPFLKPKTAKRPT